MNNQKWNVYVSEAQKQAESIMQVRIVSANNEQWLTINKPLAQWLGVNKSATQATIHFNTGLNAIGITFHKASRPETCDVHFINHGNNQNEYSINITHFCKEMMPDVIHPGHLDFSRDGIYYLKFYRSYDNMLVILMPALTGKAVL